MNKLNRLYEKVVLKELREVEITWSNGNKTKTSMAQNLTDEDIKKYYAVGKKFNIGSGPNDRMVSVKNVKILK